MTRFLKIAGFTPCRVGPLVRSVAVLAVFLAPSLASAATISGGVDERGHNYLSLDGSIAPGDPEKLAAAIFEANARGYQLDALRLNSPGGPIWKLWRGEQDADNVWCPVIYGNYRGWANAYYLETNEGQRFACAIYRPRFRS